MNLIRTQHSHLYAPKTRELVLFTNDPYLLPGGRLLIIKTIINTSAPVIKLDLDPAKVFEGDRVLIENIPGTTEVPLTIVSGESNTVVGTVRAKLDETFRFVDGSWALEPGPEAAIDLSSPGPIGSETPDSGAFTTLTASGVATLPHIHGSIAGNLYIHVRNDSGAPLTRGTPVYISGNVGDTDRVRVRAADFTDPAKMPAVGLLEQDLANNENGDAVILGELDATNTAAWAINTELFVGQGNLVTNSDTRRGKVQSAGIVARSHANTGVIVVNMQQAKVEDSLHVTYTVPSATSTYTIPSLKAKNNLIELVLERGSTSGVTIRLPLNPPDPSTLTLVVRHAPGAGDARNQIFLQYPQDALGTSWGNYKQYNDILPLYVDHFVSKIDNNIPWAAHFPGPIQQWVLPHASASPGASGPIAYWGYPQDLSTVTLTFRLNREFEVTRGIRVLGAQLIQNVGGTLGTVQGPSVDPQNPFLSIHEHDPLNPPGSQVIDLNITNPDYTVRHNVTLNPPAAALSVGNTLGDIFPSGAFDMIPGKRYTVRIKWPTFSVAPTSVRNTLILYYIDPYASLTGSLLDEAQYAKFTLNPTL